LRKISRVNEEDVPHIVDKVCVAQTIVSQRKVEQSDKYFTKGDKHRVHKYCDLREAGNR